jgi:hypothetical protein
VCVLLLCRCSEFLSSVSGPFSFFECVRISMSETETDDDGHELERGLHLVEDRASVESFDDIDDDDDGVVASYFLHPAIVAGRCGGIGSTSTSMS